MIDINTKIFISISSKPSTLGTKIYGALFRKYKVNSIYRSFVISNLDNLIQAVKTLSISGFSVSMPFKEKMLKKVDILDDTAKKTGSINTVIIKNKKLIGYNTDLFGAEKAISKIKIKKNDNILIIGSGGTSRTISYALKKKFNLNNIFILSRNNKSSRKLINDLNLFRFCPTKKFDILINCTPIGMSNEKKLPIAESYIKNCKSVIDFVNNPPNTKFINFAKKYHKKLIDGIFISLNQLSRQFHLYSNKKISYNKINDIFLNIKNDNIIKKKTKNYLKYFENKNIESLKKIFSPKIKIIDWENNIKGKKNVMAFNKKIFSKVKKIRIKILKISVINQIAFAELKIDIDNNKILVLDIIKFNNEKMITSIEAFKR